MRNRASLLVALLAIPAFFVPSGSSAQATTTYTWEQCDEGWTIESQSSAPTPASAWHRAEPGNPPSLMAMYNGPPYAGTDATELLTSAPHQWGGGSVNLMFFAKYNYEPYPESAVVEEGIHVEWSVNGFDWKDEKWLGGTSVGYPAFVEESVTFNAPAGPLQIRFRAISDALVEFSGGAVDDVTINAPTPAKAVCEGAAGGGSGGGGSSRSISIQASKSRVPAGAKVNISGKVTGAGCDKGKPVKLASRRAGTRRFRTIASSSTNQQGGYKFTTVVRRTSDYRTIATKVGECPVAKSKIVRVRARR